MTILYFTQKNHFRERTHLTHLLCNFHVFLSSADIFQNLLFEKFFQGYCTIRVSNSLESDQARLYVGPDLGPNCLQKLSVDDTSLATTE